MKTHTTHHRITLGEGKSHEQYVRELKFKKPEAYAALKHPEPLACLAYNVIELRGKKGWSQAELAKRAAVAARMIAYVESFSENISPSIRNVQSIAKALGVSFTDLFREVDMTKW